VLSSHDIGLRDLIESATLQGELARMILVTVSIAADQPMSTDLSAAVQAAVGPAAEQIQTILRDLVGITAGNSRDDSPLPCGNANA
jgi:Ni,Fe-hydrogenase maturation factor